MEQCPGCLEKDYTIQTKLSCEALIQGYRTSGLVEDVARLFPQPNGHINLLRCRHCDLRWYANAPAGDSKFYESLQQHAWYYQAEKPEYTFAAPHVPAGSKVLEVGCGKGAFAAYLRNCTYRGLEFNQQAVLDGRALGLEIENKDLEAEAKDRPAFYDVVCHFQVLEHVPEPLKFIQSCVSVLRSGGFLMVAVPAEDSFLHLAEDCFLNMPPHHLTRWSDRALERLIRRAGAEPIETWHEPVASYHAEWHRKVVVNAGLKALFGSRPEPIGKPQPSRSSRFVARSKFLTEVCFRYGTKKYPESASGQSLCLIARKL